ncbi:sulfurtransferase complex subunit TusC [Methylocaldum sp. BRCS4]|uniref:sulfurtransferase complex subunit TusC n=2 Tax=Methylocaldum TaxID=73778 RepID=UPI00098B7D7C|nr:sulfurtransferase complex subunit TusC [Methylocaldum sp. 14B]MBP1149022.1 tRNA 2-thiouridine synthesizing protein C [Methylocaldum sp. RMAD-M]MVF20220.1 sulfurtransferase complex subunit TusC [Methylocaldum sp. BRCS4]
MQKKFLFVMRSAPRNGARVRESLDMAMTAAAFDQAVRLLMLDDGVFLLKRGQRFEPNGLKPVAPLFEALALYDVEDVFVERESLRGRHLTTEDLVIPVRVVERADIAGLTAEHDLVISC